MIMNIRSSLVLITLIAVVFLTPVYAAGTIIFHSVETPSAGEKISEMIEQAESLTTQGRPADALEMYKNLNISGEPPEIQRSYYLGKVTAYVQLGNRVDAVNVLDQAIRRVPDDPEYWTMKAEIMGSAGYSYDTRYPVLLRAHHLDPSNTHIKAMLDTAAEHRQAVSEPERTLPKCEMCGYSE